MGKNAESDCSNQLTSTFVFELDQQKKKAKRNDGKKSVDYYLALFENLRELLQ
jgi:hypothetical protein